MSGELERPGIKGRVFTNGVCQEVTQEDGVTRVRLFYLPGAVEQSSPGVYSYPLAQPVTAKAGETIVLSVEQVDGGFEAEQVFTAPGGGMTVTTAYLGITPPGF